MKKIIPILGLALFTLASCASVNSMSEFYDKYDKQATVIPLPKFAVNLAKRTTDAKIFEYIKSAKVFVITDAGKGKQNSVMKNLASATKGDKYEQAVKVKIKNSNVNASFLESNGKVNNLILGVNGLKNVLVIDSKVDLTRAQLDEALENIDLSDLEGITDILK
ncbi:MAG: DUF4252 domain-containing protein [Flavobacteriaceae bacterium]|nr:DUF4252 domain-containing protein [Candidatus Onthonaster equi]